LSNNEISSLIFGSLEERTLITSQKDLSIAQPSGDLLYAAAAHQFFGHQSSIFARVGKNYSLNWVEDFEKLGIDCSSLVKLEQEFDHRTFTALSEDLKSSVSNPLDQFAKIKKPLPKSLLAYKHQGSQQDERKRRSASSWREADLAPSLHKFNGAHLCPHDFLSHRIIPGVLRERGINVITMESRKSYMHPDFRNDLPKLVNGLSAFITSEDHLHTIFTDRKIDIWQKAAFLGDFNCDCIVIQRSGSGHYIYVSADKSGYKIPAYPSQAIDPTFAGSSFAGGMLAALLNDKDPLEAALYGAASSSIAIQGTDPFYILDSYTGLAESRKNSLAQAVKRI